MASITLRILSRVGLIGCLLLLINRESPAVAITFSNTSYIAVNDSAFPPTIASPYPSTNSISGLAGQLITKATVTLHGFSHTFPSDVTVLLVGPLGQRAILMANVGGQNQYSVTNLTLTFSDDATNSLPLFTNLVSGTFKPANGYLDPYFGYSSLPFIFPPPVPPGTSNSPSLLSVFENTDPSGTWNLFIVDDVAGDSGAISNGWSLTLSVAVPLQIALVLTNVVVSWPSSATNYQLQSTPSIFISSDWTNNLYPPTLNSGRYFVTNPVLHGAMFYRLTH